MHNPRTKQMCTARNNLNIMLQFSLQITKPREGARLLEEKHESLPEHGGAVQLSCTYLACDSYKFIIRDAIKSNPDRLNFHRGNLR